MTKILLNKLFLFLFFILQSHLSFAETNFNSKNNVTEVDNSITENYSLEEDEDFENFINNKVVAISDPLEKLNRAIFAFNNFLDIYFLEPVAKLYRKITPKFFRASVGNFSENLLIPITLVNSILQADFYNFFDGFSYLLINTTLGLGGLMDIAEANGMKYQKQNFNQTLAKYGIGEGFYLVLPIFGPNSVRGTFALAIEKSINPLSLDFIGILDEKYSNAIIAKGTLSTLNNREQILDIIFSLRKESFDFYSVARSLYFQKNN